MADLGTRQNKSGFYVGVGCPGCGGEVRLDEDFFVIQCSHCGSGLRVITPDVPVVYLAPAKVADRDVRFKIDRYLKQHDLPLTGSDLHYKHLYYPYWKVNAVLLRVRNRVERFERVIGEDGEAEYTTEREKTEIGLSPYMITLAAGPAFDGVPDAVGMRTEWLKLVPYSRENTQDGYDSLAATGPWETAWAEACARVKGIGSIEVPEFGINRTELYNPTASLVYFPYVIVESYDGSDYRRVVVDGVTGRVLDYRDKLSMPSEQAAETAELDFGQLEIDFHRCPVCGVDLPPEQSWVYVCDNCHEVVALDENSNKLSGISRAVAPASPHDRLFPFWSFGVSEHDAALLRPLFGGIYDSDRLLIPALRTMNFEAVYRLAKRMSTAVPRLDLEPVEEFDRRCAPVSLSLAEARMMAELMIYRAELGRSVELPSKIRAFVPGDVGLVFAPFHPESYFYVDSVLGAVTFEKNLVG